MKNKYEKVIAISYFRKLQSFMMKRPRYKKGKRRKVPYYDSKVGHIVKSIPIENATLEDIEEILLKIYPNSQHIFDFVSGNKGLCGRYDVTPKMEELLCEKFNIEIDTEQFDCMLGEVYKTDLEYHRYK